MEGLFYLICFVILGFVGAWAKNTVKKGSDDYAVFEMLEQTGAAIVKWLLILGLPGALLVWYAWAHS